MDLKKTISLNGIVCRSTFLSRTQQCPWKPINADNKVCNDKKTYKQCLISCLLFVEGVNL